MRVTKIGQNRTDAKMIRPCFSRVHYLLVFYSLRNDLIGFASEA